MTTFMFKSVGKQASFAHRNACFTTIVILKLAAQMTLKWHYFHYHPPDSSVHYSNSMQINSKVNMTCNCSEVVNSYTVCLNKSLHPLQYYLNAYHLKVPYLA